MKEEVKSIFELKDSRLLYEKDMPPFGYLPFTDERHPCRYIPVSLQEGKSEYTGSYLQKKRLRVGGESGVRTFSWNG